MAESSLLSNDDVEVIGSVLQLSPHARTSQFTQVEKSTDDQPLISLDEIYEKTGQESIHNALAGFQMAMKSQKLARKHAESLMLVGCENWLVLPDRLNYIRGAEGFFESLKNGLVTIVKAIIKFVKGVTNWIVERLRRLFGFSKTVKEMEYLDKRSEDINLVMSVMMKDLGAPKEFDVTEFFNALPTSKTDHEQLQIIKSRLDNTEQAFKHIEESIPAFAEVLAQVNKLSRNTDFATTKYDRAMETLKRKFKNKDISIADIARFNVTLQEEIFVTLDYTEIAASLANLTKKIYGIEIKDLGVEGAMNKARETLKDTTDMVTVRLTPEVLDGVRNLRRHLASDLLKKGNKGLSKEDMMLTEKSFKKFTDILSTTDAEFIQQLANNIPFEEAKSLPGVYGVFCSRVSEYTQIVDQVLKVVHQVGKTYESILGWYTKVTELTAAYLTRDVENIIKAHEKWLTDIERQGVEKNGKPSYLLDLERDFDKNYPGLNLPEDFSRLAVAVREVDQVVFNNSINRFIKQLKG